MGFGVSLRNVCVCVCVCVCVYVMLDAGQTCLLLPPITVRAVD